ncbi:MAG: GltB/FmdC/FwdC-like GXGXG domain-containing protein [Candidatus Humimicrobiaceae bacterium]
MKGKIKFAGKKCIINALNIDYKTLNYSIRSILDEIKFSEIGSSISNIKAIELNNVLGQRYIGDGIGHKIKISIHGTPGNDLAAFMDGPEIEVFANVQDGTGNTMNSGKIIVHGSAGDILGYSMRGGEIYIKQDAGYRGGIHMKSYLNKFPVIVIGGKAGHFLGEYMAGGIIIILGINSPTNLMKKFYLFDDEEIAGDYIGTGMHGGTIFVRGEINNHKLGKEIIKSKINREDEKILKSYIDNYFKYFGPSNREKINFSDFLKLTPFSKRPYGKLYAY